MPVLPAGLRPPELHRILFATDFSDFSRNALPYVVGLASTYGSTIFVAHVIPPDARKAIGFDSRTVDFDDERYFAERMMDQFLRLAVPVTVKYEVLLEQGAIEDLFPAIVAAKGIDLAVVAPHGHGGMRRLLVGSTAEQIFRSVCCPVLVVGPEVVDKKLARGALKDIVCAIDLSRVSDGVVEYALSLAHTYHSRLTLLHVVLAGMSLYYRDEAVDSAKKQLQEMAARLAHRAVEIDCVVQIGGPAEEILSLAKDVSAGLIVMGARETRSPRLSSHLPWVVAHQVISGSRCPVLTFRSFRAEVLSHALGLEVSHAA